MQAAKLGCIVDTVTLSGEQRAMTERRAAEAGVADRVRVYLCDYRELPPEFAHAFDALVASEMVEVRPPSPLYRSRTHLDTDTLTGCGTAEPGYVLPDAGLGAEARPGYGRAHRDESA